MISEIEMYLVRFDDIPHIVARGERNDVDSTITRAATEWMLRRDEPQVDMCIVCQRAFGGADPELFAVCIGVPAICAVCCGCVVLCSDDFIRDTITTSLRPTFKTLLPGATKVGVHCFSYDRAAAVRRQ